MPETKAFLASSRTLAQNTAINLIGQFSVAIIAFLSVPIIVKTLGPAQYGILSLAIVAFGTFAILDLGLGRSTTKFVAECLSKDDLDRLNPVIWTSFTLQVLIGIIGGGLLALVAGILAQRVIHLPIYLIVEAQWSFYLLAVSVPLVLGASSLRGALEGAQRFDRVNLVKILLNASTYLIPLIAGLAGMRVSFIVGLLVLSRLLGLLAYLLFCFDVLPMLRRLHFFDSATLPSIFSFAKWVALSNLIVPFLSQVDRFLIATLLTVEAVTFFAVPFEILNALWIIPGSIAAALFPAFSGLKSSADARIGDLYMRPLKYLLILLGPLVVLLVMFSQDLLLAWQGPVFAERSAVVLQILVVGALINSLEWVPANLVMGLNHPQITAFCHLLQLPLYLGSAYLLISRWGITGAAAAFTLRVTFEAIFIFVASWRLAPQARRSLRDGRLLGSVATIGLLTMALLTISRAFGALASQLAGAAVVSIAYAVVAWTRLLDTTDRELVWSLLPVTRGRAV